MVVTMRGKPAMHHSKVDLGQPLSHRPRQGCSAIRPICCIRTRSGEHATATRHSAKMRRGDFSPKAQNKRQWPTNAAPRNLLER
jgi:hypothetical protein